jgi:hypothetical protein
MESILQQIEQFYSHFLSLFPPVLHPVISIIVVVVIIYSLIQVVRKDFIYLIVLVILLPASIPVLKSVGQGIVDLLKFLLHMG